MDFFARSRSMLVLLRFTCGLAVAALVLAVPLAASADPVPLDMHTAVNLALQRDSVLRQRAAEKQAVAAQAVAAGQLPDPQLSVGIQNLPTNSFAVGRDGMTRSEEHTSELQS